MEAGDALTLTCKAFLDPSMGMEAVNWIRWFFNGDRIKGDGITAESSSYVETTLSFPSLSVKDSGSYLCRAEYNDSSNTFVESYPGYVTVQGTCVQVVGVDGYCYGRVEPG